MARMMDKPNKVKAKLIVEVEAEFYDNESSEVTLMELPVQFVYTENGVEKSSIDENKRMRYIDELNRELHNRSKEENSKITMIADTIIRAVSL